MSRLWLSLCKEGESRIKSPVLYFKSLTQKRDGEWPDDGVNIIGIRDPVINQPKKNTDVFLVIVKNKIMGYFIGSTEPGVKKWVSKKYKTSSDKLGGVAHLQIGDYEYYVMPPKTDFAPGKKGYLSAKKKVPVDRDKNKDGVIQNKDEIFYLEDFYGSPHEDIFNDMADGIYIHFGGSILLYNNNVGGWSWGCQTITGNRYYDENMAEYQYWLPKWKDDKTQQGAYVKFIEIVKNGSQGGKKIFYHLFSKDSIEEKYFDVKNWQTVLSSKQIEANKNDKEVVYDVN